MQCPNSGGFDLKWTSLAPPTPPHRHLFLLHRYCHTIKIFNIYQKEKGETEGQCTKVTEVRVRQTTSTTMIGDPAWEQTGLSLQISTHLRSLKDIHTKIRSNYQPKLSPAGCCELTKPGAFGQHLRRRHPPKNIFQTFHGQVTVGLAGGQVCLYFYILF